MVFKVQLTSLRPEENICNGRRFHSGQDLVHRLTTIFDPAELRCSQKSLYKEEVNH